MLALYRCGRQADALAAYRAARQALVDELGLEPSAALQDLERAILRHDPALAAPATGAAPARDAAPPAAPRPAPRPTIAVAALATAALGRLLELAGLLASDAEREIVAATTVGDAARCPPPCGRCTTRARPRGRSRRTSRVAAFTSLTPGSDLARLAAEQDASVVLVDAPDGLLEDARLLTLLADAPCDVAVVVGDGVPRGPVLVPFTGSAHDWAATELGAWFARALGASLLLAGASTGASGRDASRLLANASLAVQRGLGVATEPRLVEPSPDGLLQAAEEAGLVVVGLTDRWRHEGLGRARTALAAAPRGPRCSCAAACAPAASPRATRTPASPGRSGRPGPDRLRARRPRAAASPSGTAGRRTTAGRRAARMPPKPCSTSGDGADRAQHALPVLVGHPHERHVADALAVGVEPHVPVREVRLHAARAPPAAVHRPRRHRRPSPRARA